MPDQPRRSSASGGPAATEAAAQTQAEPEEAQPSLASTELESTQAFQASNPPEADTAFTHDEAATARTEVDPEATQAPTSKPEVQAPAGETESASAVKKAAAAKTNVLGDYRLVKKLGVGGMGEVFKGRQISLDRDVAVKVLAKHLAGSPSFVQRFYREARIMAKLDHPNIVRCFGVGEDHGFHYLAMEYLDGGSIQDCLKKQGKLSLGDALHVLLACAHALQHAHELDMIHRDIKPDNILLTRKGVVKVADLGLAKALSEDLSLTQTGTGAGTPYYMSPEQARDAKKVDNRTDIYSLGVMLYCFVTGQLPFQGETALDLIQAKEKGKFPAARTQNPDVPARLDLIIDKMLAKEPKHRYQTCAELILDLESLDLANATLSFFQDAAPAPRAVLPAPTKGSATAGSGGKKPAKPGTRIPTAPAKIPSAPPQEEEAPTDFWYINYKMPQGKTVTRKMTQAEVLTLIEEEHFDAKHTQASRTLKGGYRDIATYREFERAVRARMTHAKSRRRGAKLQEMYEKLEEQQKQEHKWRWVRNLVRKVGGGVGLLIWLACLAVVAVGAFFLIKFLIHWLGSKVEGLDKEKKSGDTPAEVKPADGGPPQE